MSDPFKEQLSTEIKQAFAEQDWIGALTVVDLWCRLYPNHAQGWYWRAGCLMYAGHLEQALADAERSVDLNPDDINARTLRGNLKLKIAEEQPEPEVDLEPERKHLPECAPEPDIEAGIDDVDDVEVVVSPEPEPEQISEVVPEPELELLKTSDPEIVSFETTERASEKRPTPMPVAPRVSSARQVTSDGRRSRQERPWGAIAALAVVVVAISWTVIDRIRVPDLRVNQQEASEIRKRIYASIVPPHPSVVSRTRCEPLQLAEYVSVFGRFQPNPREWESAKFCLEAIGNEESAIELLNYLRPGYRRWGSSALFQKTSRRGTTSDVRSVLIRMGDAASNFLVIALGDQDLEVRQVAAEALAYRRNEEDVRALVRNCKSSSREVREVVASILGDLVGSGQLEGSEGFELMRWMAADESAVVRFEVAKALIVFEGSEAHALAESMTGDPSRRVSEAARRVVIESSRREK